MVAARIPAMTKPARIAGSEPVASLIKTFSAADLVSSSVGRTCLPTMPMKTATASEIVTQTIAMRRERVSSFSLRIAMKRRSTCGMPK